MGGGGRKIHCDFCGISYPANAKARRTHNKGGRHRSLRAKFYEQVIRATQKAVSYAGTKKTAIPTNHLAAAYWIAKHYETSPGARMLLRPKMSSQQSTLMSASTILMTGSSQIPNPTHYGGEKETFTSLSNRKDIELQLPYTYTRSGAKTFKGITPSFSSRTPNQALQNSLFSTALPPPSLSLDGDPADIRTSWLS